MEPRRSLPNVLHLPVPANARVPFTVYVDDLKMIYVPEADDSRGGLVRSNLRSYGDVLILQWREGPHARPVGPLKDIVKDGVSMEVPDVSKATTGPQVSQPGYGLLAWSDVYLIDIGDGPHLTLGVPMENGSRRPSDAHVQRMVRDKVQAALQDVFDERAPLQPLVFDRTSSGWIEPERGGRTMAGGPYRVESLPARRIERLTRENKHFRRVLDTTPHLQVVLMTIPKGEEIGEEVHHGHDQFFRIEEGKAAAVINGKRRVLHDGDAILVPQGTRHNIVNAGKGPLKLYTLYAPPRHMPGTVQHSRPRGESLPTPPPSRRLVDRLIDEAEKAAAAEGHPETVVVDLRDRPDLRTLAIQSASEAGWSIQPTDTGMILKDMHPQLVTSDPDSRLDRAARFYAARYDLSADRVRGDRALLERAAHWYDVNEQDLKNVRSAKDVRDLDLLVDKPPLRSESCPSTGERTPTVEVEPGGMLMRLDPSKMPMGKIGKMIDEIAAEEYGETPERDYSESYSRSRDGSRFYDTGWTNLRSIIDYMPRGRETLVDLAGALESADFAVMIAGDDDCREPQSDSPVIWLYPGKAEPVFAILRGDQRSICKLAYVFTDLGYTVHQSTRPSYSRLEIERRPPEEGLPRRGPRQSKIVHRFGAPGRPYNDLDTRLAALHPENTHRAIERTTQEMIREYSRMLAEDPDNAAVRLERAEAWLDLGSPGLARMDIQMVLDSQVPGEIRRRAKGLVLRLEQGESLPASVKMPAKARRMWEHVYQSQLERGVEKDRAAASAWSQVKKHYVKQPSGRWVSRTDA